MLDVALGERHSEVVGLAKLVVVHFLRKEERVDLIVKRLKFARSDSFQIKFQVKIFSTFFFLKSR